MAAANPAAAHSMKFVKLALSLVHRGFSSSKCKTAAKLSVARIKLLRNKREAVVRQMRRDIAMLLQTGQDATARIRVEHVIREQNVLAANEIIELFCELVVARLSIIAKQRECPADLKEGVASLIFAAPRCSEIPELSALKNVFEKKYGKDFVSAAVELRPSCGVNRLLIDKLSVRTPAGQVKLKLMKEIAKEHHIEWDTAETEKELLKPPEELIEGPRTFVSAASLPIKPETKHSGNNAQNGRTINSRGSGNLHFQDSVSAAEAAAESAKQAIAAARAAAYIVKKDLNHDIQGSTTELGLVSLSGHSTPASSCNVDHEFGGERANPPQSFGKSRSLKNEETRNDESTNYEMAYRRYSYNPVGSEHSDIKFDNSDGEDENRTDEAGGSAYQPPERNPPPVPSSRIHPKLPDYDTLAARFEALKYKKM